MKSTKALIFITAMAIASGAAIATAQNVPADAPNGNPEMTTPMKKAEFRGRHGDKDRGRDHGNRGERRNHGRGHQGGAMMMEIFAKVDADGNGSVTQEEINSFRTAQVSGADTNGDGALSIEEFDTIYRDFTRSRMVDAFQGLDADGDGVISPAELDAKFGKVVEKMDRNGDGALTIEDGGRRG